MTEHEFLEHLRKQIEDGLKLWESPSISIGIIKDGNIIMCEGFGKRNVKQNATEKTIYQLASCSKAFTSALVAIMVDQGKLSWDIPLIQYLPNVRFYDDYTTSNITLRDLLCHRSGLPRHEYAWYGTDFSKEELVFNLRYLEPNKPIRTKFQYNNYGYMLAGYAVEQVTAKSWEQCVEEYILKPLGMNRTNTFVDALLASDDYAQPYDRDNPAIDMMKGTRMIKHYKMPHEDYQKGIGSPMGPAASVNSCVEDMLEWLDLHLNQGEFKGKRIISKEAMIQMHQPNMILPQLMDMPQDETTLPSYGLGWFVENYRGHTLVQHGGNLDGFSTYASFIPDLNLGVIAITNMNVSDLHVALSKEIYDYYIGVESGNWIKRYHDYHTEISKKRLDFTSQFTKTKIEGTTPSHQLEAYTGIYVRNGYTPVEIYSKNNELYLKFTDADTKLTHYHYETFITNDLMGGGEIPPGLPVTFNTAPFKAEIDTITMPLCFEEGSAPIVFKKQK